jgi:hypothetical protein
MIQERFGSEIVKDSAIEDLNAALRLRGAAAHGHLRVEEEEDFRRLVRAIYSMEALCFLLTAVELPIGEAGLERIRSNPLVRDYRWSV